MMTPNNIITQPHTHFISFTKMFVIFVKSGVWHWKPDEYSPRLHLKLKTPNHWNCLIFCDGSWGDDTQLQIHTMPIYISTFHRLIFSTWIKACGHSCFFCFCSKVGETSSFTCINPWKTKSFGPNPWKWNILSQWRWLEYTKQKGHLEII